jgi:hypothetical protein
MTIIAPKSSIAAKLKLAESCPKWGGCNAAFCPAVGGRHLQGERVCLYLREAVKPGGKARIRHTLRGELAEAVLRAAPQRLSRSDALGNALRRTSLVGSKIAAARRLNGGEAA